jgi:hypothetical protein
MIQGYKRELVDPSDQWLMASRLGISILRCGAEENAEQGKIEVKISKAD